MGTGTAGAVEHSDEQGESFGRGEYAGWKCQRDRPCGRSQKVWSFRDAFPVEVQVRTYEESHRGGNAERGGRHVVRPSCVRLCDMAVRCVDAGVLRSGFRLRVLSSAERHEHPFVPEHRFLSPPHLDRFGPASTAASGPLDVGDPLAGAVSGAVRRGGHPDFPVSTTRRQNRRRRGPADSHRLDDPRHTVHHPRDMDAQRLPCAPGARGLAQSRLSSHSPLSSFRPSGGFAYAAQSAGASPSPSDCHRPIRLFAARSPAITGWRSAQR